MPLFGWLKNREKTLLEMNLEELEAYRLVLMGNREDIRNELKTVTKFIDDEKLKRDAEAQVRNSTDRQKEALAVAVHPKSIFKSRG